MLSSSTTPRLLELALVVSLEDFNTKISDASIACNRTASAGYVPTLPGWYDCENYFLSISTAGSYKN